MNFGSKAQRKIRDIIQESFGNDTIDPESLWKKGYKIVKLESYENTKEHIEGARKPTAQKGKVLVFIMETIGKFHHSYVYSRYWVDLPRDIALSILALGHLPDLQNSE